MHTIPPDHSSHEAPPVPPRRNFLVKFGAFIVGAFVTLVPLAAGGVFFLNPLLKKKGGGEGEAGDDPFRMVGKTTSLSTDGSPTLYQVTGTKQDAWTTYPETPLGAVYIRRNDDDSLTCFNARCTHLGCTVKYRPDRSEYVCPCHASAFSLNGERSNKIPPRNMDTLECQIRNEDEIWVRFMNFRGGREEKIPV